MLSPSPSLVAGATPLRPGPSNPPLALAPPAGSLAAALADFSPAGADLLQRRALLQRSDTKFLLPVALLPELLEGMTAHYAALGAADPAGSLGTLGSPYRTLYFDTADRRCFHDHRRGRRLRHKLRIRSYDDRRLTFLEIKSRRSSALTDKDRLELPYGQTHLDKPCAELIRRRCRLEVGQLHPQLWINYRRVTLIGLHREERCTLDFSLSISDVAHTREPAAFDGLAFLELKQPEPDASSPMMRALRALQLRPRSVSKYLVAVCELHPQERANTLRASLRAVRQLRACAAQEAA
jgi:VTC domain